MSAVVGSIWSLVAAAGATLAVSAPFGAAGHGGQYLAGHVLLGLGAGQVLAAAVRVAARRILRKGPRATRASLTAVPTAAGVAGPETAGVRATAVETTAVTVLRPRPPAVVPLRGRHAA